MKEYSKRNLAQQFFDKLHEKGYSASKALEFLRSQGLGYRRHDFLKDWRTHFSYLPRKEREKYTPKKYVIPEETYEPKNYSYNHKYVHVVEVKGTDLITGAPVVRHVTVESDYRPAKSTVLNMARKRINMNPEKYLIEISSLDIVDFLTTP